MLPGIRALLGAIAAAVGLMTMAFGLVAAFRVAQDTRAGVVRSDIAQRGRMPVLAADETTRLVMIETPAPLEPNPIGLVEVAPEPDSDAPQAVEQVPENPTEVASAPAEVEPQRIMEPVAEPPADAPPATRPRAGETVQAEQPAEVTTIEQLIAELAPPEPPMGGPLAEQRVTHVKPPARKAAQDIATRIKKKKAAQAAAKKALAQRIARERKAAARKARAAQARAKQQAARSFNNPPVGNSFGTFSNAPFGTGAFGTGAFGNSAPRP